MLWLRFACLLLILQIYNAAGNHPKEHPKDHPKEHPKAHPNDHPKREPVDYCNFKCGRNHIACNNNGRRGPHCALNVGVVHLDHTVQTLILNLHNEKRNEVAGGSLKHLPSATHMAHMQWDDELAHLAELQALRCSNYEDHCISTARFEHPGQNTALLEYVNETEQFPTVWSQVENRIKYWFSTSSLCKAEHIHNTHDKHNPSNVCTFTVAVIDKNNHIGCGAVHFEHPPKDYFHMVCNYAHKIEHGKPIYKTGDVASDCKTGKDKKYKHLCSAKEKYQ